MPFSNLPMPDPKSSTGDELDPMAGSDPAADPVDLSTVPDEELLAECKKRGLKC